MRSNCALSRRIAASIDPLFTVALQQTVGLAWALAIWPIGLHGCVSELAFMFSPAILADAYAAASRHEMTCVTLA